MLLAHCSHKHHFQISGFNLDVGDLRTALVNDMMVVVTFCFTYFSSHLVFRLLFHHILHTQISIRSTKCPSQYENSSRGEYAISGLRLN